MSSSVLRSQQLHPLSEPTPTASCIILWALWLPIYLIQEHHVTYSDPTVRDWILLHQTAPASDFIVWPGLLWDCKQHPIHSVHTVWVVWSESAWAEINSKESVLLWCFARCVIVKQLCAQGHLWLNETAADKLIHMPLLVLFMLREEALCSSTYWWANTLQENQTWIPTEPFLVLFSLVHQLQLLQKEKSES